MNDERRDLIVVLLLAIAVHAAYMWLSAGDYFYPDSRTYLAPAQGMLHGFGFAASPEMPETLRTPGYPLFLLPFLAFGAPASAVVMAQHLLSAMVIVSVFVFVRRRVGSRRAAFAAAAVMLFDTITLHYANKVLSETLFTAGLMLLFLMLLAVVHARHALAVTLLAGILTGVLVLVRPVAIAYFACVLVYLAVQRATRRTLAIYACAALLLPVGWAIRNRRETGVFTVASIAGTNMLLHRGAPALAMDDAGDFDTRLALRQAELLARADAMILAAQHEESIGDVPHAVAAKVYGEMGRKLFVSHPRGAMLVTLRGIAINLFASDWDAVAIVSELSDPLVRALVSAANALVIVAAIAGIAVLWQRDRGVALLLALTIAYFIGTSSGSEAEARFRVPVVPQLAIAASALLARR